jgi:hypothetical protein
LVDASAHFGIEFGELLNRDDHFVLFECRGHALGMDDVVALKA